MQTTRNVLKVYRAAIESDITEGLAWYPTAHNLAFVVGRGDILKGAGIVSAYSPQTSWPLNTRYALQASASGIANMPTLGNSNRSAQRILDGENPFDVLKGLKTRSFTNNILHAGNVDDPTIDVHAYSIAIGKKTPAKDMPSLGKARYEELQEAFRRAAKIEGIKPSDMQAITWVAWRRVHPAKTAKKG